MFYRYLKSAARVPMDFEDVFEGTCFLAGGAPSLADENLLWLYEPGVNLLAMNNTASLFQGAVDFWIGGDKPMCYSERILLDPKIMKFATISRRDYEVAGRKWRDVPNTYFFGTKDDFSVRDFMRRDRDLAWWKNTFYLALQLIHRLGFRRVFLIGCGFRLDKEQHYSYAKTLDDAEFDWNTRLYSNTVARLKELKPVFDSAGFEVISATPGSLLNHIYPSVTFDEAVDETLRGFPKDYDVEKCLHSSKLEAAEAKGR